MQRYIERPLLVRGRKFDIRLFVLLVADSSTRSWRRRSKSATSNRSSNSCGVARSEQSKTTGGVKDPGESSKPPACSGRGGGVTASVGPCPVTAWCHRDAYVRMSSVKYSNDPGKAKDRVRELKQWETIGSTYLERVFFAITLSMCAADALFPADRRRLRCEIHA